MRLAKQSQFIPLQNVAYFITLLVWFVKYSHFTKMVCYNLNVQFQGQMVNQYQFYFLTNQFPSLEEHKQINCTFLWLKDTNLKHFSNVVYFFIFQFTIHLKNKIKLHLRGQWLQKTGAEFPFLGCRLVNYLLYMKIKGNFKNSEASFGLRWEHSRGLLGTKSENFYIYGDKYLRNTDVAKHFLLQNVKQHQFCRIYVSRFIILIDSGNQWDSVNVRFGDPS